jgi:cell fate (sporulation/competence/biofilm development) regulator YlbF (YheA/YmcA/DUF963 family)
MDAAIHLGEAIADSNELSDLRESESVMLNDEKAQKMMDEYRKSQDVLVMAARNNVEKEELDRLKSNMLKMQDELNAYDITKSYLDKTAAFQAVMKSINDILQFYINGEEDCGGDCSGCSGCSHE